MVVSASLPQTTSQQQHNPSVSVFDPASDQQAPTHLLPSILPKLNTTRLDDTTTNTASGNGNGAADTLSRTESNSSISSARGGNGSRTANFFASSSPVVNPVDRPFPPPARGHVRNASSSSQKSQQGLYNCDPSSPQAMTRLAHSNSMRSSRSQSSHLPKDGIDDEEALMMRRGSSQLRHGMSSSSTHSFSSNADSPAADEHIYLQQYGGPTLIRVPTLPDHDTSGLSSASSIRSRRNWDEFEGKPIIPLPSPAVRQDSMEMGDSMFINPESPRHASAGQPPLSSYFASGVHSAQYTLPTSLTSNRLASPPSGISSARRSSGTGAENNLGSGRSTGLEPPLSPGFGGAFDLDRTASTSSARQGQTGSKSSASSKTSNFFGSGPARVPHSSPVPPPARAPSFNNNPSRTSSMASNHSRNPSDESSSSIVDRSWTNAAHTASPLPSPSTVKTLSASSSLNASPSGPSLERIDRHPTLLFRKEGARTLEGAETLARSGTDTQQYPPKLAPAEGPSTGPAEPLRSLISADVQMSSSRHKQGPSESAAGESMMPSAFHRGGESVDPSRSARDRPSLANMRQQEVVTQTPSALRLDGLPSQAIARELEESVRISPPATRRATARAGSFVDRTSAGQAKTLQSKSSFIAGRPLSGSPGPRQAFMEGSDAPADESEDESVGRVGRYQVQSTLGVGAFSKVVLAAPIPPTIFRTSPVIGDDEARDGIFPSNGAGSGTASIPGAPERSGTMTPLGPTPSGPTNAPVPKKKSSLQSWGRAFRKNSSSTALRAKFGGSQSNSVAPTPLTNSNASTLSTSSSPLSSGFLEPETMDGSFMSSSSGAPSPRPLYALKMMAREPCEQNERMRVSWVREVEVLKHIQHPSLVQFISSFSTPRHHVLVLERVGGGELFDLLASHHAELAKREWLARRLFSELANAVGWMHSIHLVHRDIKLENIILTREVFSTSPSLTPAALGSGPLLKLTDFGLSRFIDPNSPLLETRCGSEEYASPELIIGKKYDGRKTDVWAMGVVLYALVCGSLPFIESSSSGGGMSTQAGGGGGREGTKDARDAKERKAHLLRIAKGDLRWPAQVNDESVDAPPATLCPPSARLVTPFAKHIVSRLLRRDATKRCNAWDCFEDPWLTHGSFFGRASPGEATAMGQDTTNGSESKLGMPPSPRTEAGKAWLRDKAEVRDGDEVVRTGAKYDD